MTLMIRPFSYRWIHYSIFWFAFTCCSRYRYLYPLCKLLLYLVEIPISRTYISIILIQLAYGYNLICYPLLKNAVYNNQNEANRSPHFILLLLFIYKEENTEIYTS